jgi:TolB protein
MSDGERLAIVNVKTRSHRLLGPRCSNNGGDWNTSDPAWSPDGSQIAFGFGDSLYVVTSSGTDAHVVATVQGEPEVGHLSWSPDGTTLLFDTWFSIYTVGADGSHLTTLVAGDHPYSGPYFPSWSPDGKRILYLNTPCTDIWCHRPYEVWVMNADGTQKDRLFYHSIDTVADFAPPVWSPDGQQIAFAINASTESGLMIINADGTGLHNVADAADTADFAWQPLP